MPAPRRTDKNQQEIVDGLRDLGYVVTDTHVVGNGFPDIVVRSRTKRLVAIEIKVEGSGLNQAEIDWHTKHEGSPKGIAYNLDQARAIMACYDDPLEY